MFLSLYGMDDSSLKRDLGKLVVFGAAEVEPAQRFALLRCIYGVVALYIQDFSEIISMCEQNAQG